MIPAATIDDLFIRKETEEDHPVSQAEEEPAVQTEVAPETTVEAIVDEPTDPIWSMPDGIAKDLEENAHEVNSPESDEPEDGIREPQTGEETEEERMQMKGRTQRSVTFIASTDTDPELVEIAPIEEASLEYIKRHDGSRRMSFKVPAKPDVATEQTSNYSDFLKRYCGDDVLDETKNTKDDEFNWDSTDVNCYTTRAELTADQMTAVLMGQLDRANDETDNLFKHDNLDIGHSVIHPVIEDPQPPKAKQLDQNEIRQWYYELVSGYDKPFQVVKICKDLTKEFVYLTFNENVLTISKSNGFVSHRLSMCGIVNVKMGYMSEEFRTLLDVTPCNHPIATPEVCVVVGLPRRTLSLVFPSEVTRNGFVFLIRVEIEACRVLRSLGKTCDPRKCSDVPKQ